MPTLTVQKYNQREVTSQSLKGLWKKFEEGKEVLSFLPKYAVHIMVDMDYVVSGSVAKDPNTFDPPVIQFKGNWATECHAELLNGYHRFMVMREYVLANAIKSKKGLDAQLRNNNVPADAVPKLMEKLVKVRKTLLEKGKWVAIIYDRGKKIWDEGWRERLTCTGSAKVMASPYKEGILQLVASNPLEYMKEDSVEDSFSMLMTSLKTVDPQDFAQVIANFLARHSSFTKNSRAVAVLQNIFLMQSFGLLFRCPGIWSAGFVKISSLYSMRQGSLGVSSEEDWHSSLEF